MITVERILHIPKLQNIEVAAGRGGLGRQVSHVTVMEVPDVIRWLKGDDFLITSLYALKDDVGSQCTLLRELAGASCACVAVKIGQYVKELSPELRAAAEEIDLPLLIIPYDLSYIDIIINAMRYIFEEKNPRTMLERYIKDLIFDTYMDQELMVERGKLLGFGIEQDRYIAMSLQFSQDELAGKDAREALWRTGIALSRFASSQKGLHHCIAVNMENHSTILLDAAEEETLSRLIPLIEKEAEAQLRYALKNHQVYISYGTAETGPEGIRKTYFNSIYAAGMGRIFFPDRKVYTFRDMELYHIIAEAAAKSRVYFFDRVLNKIDSKEILETLVVYFESDKNIEATAEKLYAHKNTVKYRLQRVYELTGFNVKDFNDSIMLYMAVIAYKLKNHAPPVRYSS
jgi:purine catabolism regulator